jgi:hypothetical protein
MPDESTPDTDPTTHGDQTSEPADTADTDAGMSVAEQIDAFADEVVARMPDFTSEQREHLRRLLNPPYRYE